MDPSKRGNPCLAVLIDADNTSAQLAPVLLKAIAHLGEAAVRRVYGDFSSAALRSWVDAMAKHALTPQQSAANIPGKNATDIALVIDAMDLLHSGRYDGFCLVSSDSDFTRLALRIREQGLPVFGFGANTTPESFRQACKQFFPTDSYLPAPPKPPKPPMPKPAPPTPSGVTEPIETAVALINSAIARLPSENGWIPLHSIGTDLLSLAPGFKPRRFGHAKLSNLITKSGAFEMRRDASKHLFVRPLREDVYDTLPIALDPPAWVTEDLFDHADAIADAGQA